MWPGFGDNIRVLDWVLQRVENKDSEKGTVKTEIGYVPAKNSFNLDGLDNINWDELFRIDRPFWTEEVYIYRNKYFLLLSMFYILYLVIICIILLLFSRCPVFERT